jgi:hypothetical protein
LIKKQGQIGIVVPGLRNEFTAGTPDFLKPFWNWEYSTFHSPDWWSSHFEKSEKVSILFADFLEDGWQLWRKWHQIRQIKGFPYDENEAALLEIDQGANLGFSRIVARKI